MARRFLSGMAFGSAGAAAALFAYVRSIRPWHLQWGATEGETRRRLPGDDLIPHPKIQATHAVTIRAPAELVWPWLVQMGQGRGGMYAYDWIDNLMRLEMQSSRLILPEYQNLKVGDVVPLVPSGFGPSVVLLEPYRALVLGGRTDAQSDSPFRLGDKTPGAFFAMSWAFFLDPVTPRSTRLIERFRLDWSPATLKNALYMYGFVEPGAFVMERKMLLGIKERAEALAQAQRGTPSSRLFASSPR